jgi:G3E family GTPase
MISSTEDLATLPLVVAVRPLLMFTGFLGAGKTTLLRSLLDDLATREHLADVILNDRENSYIDQQTLQNHAASVDALTGSCVCRNSHLTGKEELQLEQSIKAINPRASRATASSLAGSLSEAIRQNDRHIPVTKKTNQNSHFSSRFSVTPTPKPHLHDRHQLAHEFTGCHIIFPKAVDSSRVTTWLEKLPDSVVRTKALITLSTDPDCHFS